MTANRGTSGFTLIELLISVGIFAGVITGAYLCLEAGLRSRSEVAARLDAAQTARVALRLLAQDLRGACVFHPELELVGLDRELEGMQADNIDFITHNWSPRARGEGDLAEVSYFVDRVPETGGYGLFRRRDPSPDMEFFSGGDRELVAEGLRGFQLEYSDGFLWYDTWGRDPQEPLAGGAASWLAGNLSGLPEAVRVTIAFSATDRSRSAAAADREKPFVLQTVVRLELAGRANGYDVPGSSAETDETSESAPESEGGGR